MADVVIRFIGDASGLASFYSSVGRQTDAFMRTLNKSFVGQFNDALGGNLKTQEVAVRGLAGKNLGNIFGKSFQGLPAAFAKTGAQVRGLAYEFDTLNNVVKVTGQTGIKLANGTFLPVGKIDLARTSVTALTSAMDNYHKALNRIQDAETEVGRRIAQLGIDRAAGLAAVDPYTARKEAAARRVAALGTSPLAQEIREREARNTDSLFGAAKANYDAKTLRLRAELTKEVSKASAALTRAIAAEAKAMGDPRIAGYDDNLRKIRSEAAATIRDLRNRARAERGNLQRTLLADPTEFPAVYRQLRGDIPGAQSRQLLQQLQKGGLGTTPAAIYKQGAEFDAPVRNLITGVTELGGRWKDSTGIMQQWRAEIDDTGKVITRFGGNLRGISKITDQISRNFQKVIEWTVATTVVFGSLSVAVAALDIIKTLDADLARFSITANLSAEGTAKFYDQMIQVATVTATPIEELIKASDDLALAVRRPGESVEELTRNVAALATSVGIYTNLTGSDTVSATEQLVAIMNQLGLEAQDVNTILNKVTASAGGQSGAISDITKGLAVMAEAGKQAHLSVDEQIGIIKTLSQVTSKSPAEVATAFKNLVGALENPAALKALKKFNIGLISEGNSIIDVYADIADKIASGVIGPNQVSGLLRAISGGPRRAPDAAALLANIDTVLDETKVSANATNEAFLANARVLDTLTAKFTQFTNVLKDKTFRQFGEAFRAIATGGIEAVTSLLDIISLIPPQFITIGAQLAIFGTAFTLLGKVAGPFLKAISESRLSMGLFGRATQQQMTLDSALVASQKQVTLSLRERTAATLAAVKAGNFSAFGLGKGGVGRAALGAAALGGGLTVLSGGSGLQGLATAAQTAGLAIVSMAPGMFKLAGVALLAAGSILGFNTEAKATTGITRDAAAAILNAYDSYQAAARNVEDLESAQKDLKSQIDTLKNSSDTSTDAQLALNQAERELIDTTIQLANSQSQLSDSINAVGKADPQMGALVQGFEQGIVSAEELKTKIRELQILLLKESFPDIDLTTRPSYLLDPISSGTLPQDFKLPGNVRDYFGEGGKNIIEAATITLPDGTERRLFDTAEGLAAVRKELEAYAPNNPFRLNAEQAIKAWENLHLSVESAKNQILAYNLSLAQTEPLYGTEDFKSVQNLLKLMAQLVLLKEQGKLSDQDFGTLFRDAELKLQNAQTNFTGVPIEDIKNYITRIADAYGFTQGLVAGTDEWKVKVNEVALSVLNIPNLFGEVANHIQQASEATSEFSEKMDDLRQNLISDLAQESLQLRLDITGGEDTDETADRIAAAREAVIELTTAFDDLSANTGSAFTETMLNLAESLEPIPGLEGASSLATADFVTQLLNLIVTGKLTTQEINTVKQAIIDYLAEAEKLAAIKLQFPKLGLTGDTPEELLGQLQAKRAQIPVDSPDYLIQIKPMDAAIAALESYIAEANKLPEPIQILNDLLLEASDNTQAMGEVIIAQVEAIDALISDVAQRSGQLEADFAGGVIDEEEYQEQRKRLDGMIEGFNALKAAIEAAIDTPAEAEQFDAAFKELQANFAEIPGLEDAASLSTEQFINKLFALAETMNLNSTQMGKLHKKIQDLIAIAARIAEIKTTWSISPEVNAEEALRILKGFRAALVAMSVIPGPLGALINFTNNQKLKGLDAAIAFLENIGSTTTTIANQAANIISQGSGTTPSGSSSKKKATPPDVSTVDIPDEIFNAVNRDALIKEAIKRARELQSKIPGADKEAKNDIVELLKGTQRILEVRGVKDDLLRRALEELADIERKKLEFETKADTIRRIRVGGGDFSAIANVPLNSKTGVSLGDQNNINITLNVNGTVTTPAQLAQLADLIAAALKRQIANG